MFFEYNINEIFSYSLTSQLSLKYLFKDYKMLLLLLHFKLR